MTWRLCALLVATVVLVPACGAEPAPEASVEVKADGSEQGWWVTEVLDENGVAQVLTSEPVEPRQEVIRIKSDVYFETNSSRIEPSEASRLSPVAERIIANQTPVVIVGHTDERGTPSYNHDLGLDRAVSIRELLRELGVPPDLIIGVESRGESCPSDTTDTEAGRAANRRVEIHPPGMDPSCR